MKRDEMVLRAAKEIAVKYVETARLPLSGFREAFATIYSAIDEMVPDREDDRDD